MKFPTITATDQTFPIDPHIDLGRPVPDHRVFHRFEELVGLRDAWDILASTEGDFYCSFDWCSLWWQYYGGGRRLEIHVFSQQDELVGIIPLFHEELTLGPCRIHVVRLVGCDYSTAPCNIPIRREFAQEVLAALMARINTQPWDLIQFGRMAGYFPHSDLVIKAMISSGHAGQVELTYDTLPHTIIDLPKTFDKYLQNLSHRERHNIRKENRRLSEDYGITCDDDGLAEDPVTGMRRFIEFHQNQWVQKGHQGHFTDWPQAKEFHEALAKVLRQAGRLSLRRIHAGDMPLSMTYAIGFGKRLHWFLSARSMDPQWHFCFPGRVGACDLIKAAIEEGMDQVELGLGYYPYKMKLGGKILRVANLVAVRASRWSRMKVCMFRTFALLHEILGYRFWYLYLSPRLSFRHRAFHPRWIRRRMWPSDASRLFLRLKMALYWPAFLVHRCRRLIQERQQGDHLGGGLKEILMKPFRRRKSGFTLNISERNNNSEAEMKGLLVRRYRSFDELEDMEKEGIRRYGGNYLCLAFENKFEKGHELWLGLVNDEPAIAYWMLPPAIKNHSFSSSPNGQVVLRKCFEPSRFKNLGVDKMVIHHLGVILGNEGITQISFDDRGI